jgi:hypothetical protein
MAPVSFIAKLLTYLAVGTLVDGRHAGHAHSRRNYDSESDDLISLPETGGSSTTSVPRPNMLKMRALRPTKEQVKERRDGQGSFASIPEESLYWGAEDGTLAELWMSMEKENERIVDAEYFDDLIHRMECPRDGDKRMVIDFHDEADLQEAAEVWSWVNERKERTLLLTVGEYDCGWNDDRILYRIERVAEYSKTTKTIVMEVEAVTWKKALRSYDLKLGKMAVPAHVSDLSERTRTKRSPFDILGFMIKGNYTRDYSLPLNLDASGKSVAVNVGVESAKVLCNNCTVTGSFELQAKFRMRWFKIKEAYVEMRTPGINATVDMDINYTEELKKTIEKSKELLEYSPFGIEIPGIVTIAPTMSLSLGASIAPLRIGATVRFAGTMTISESSARLDFCHRDQTYRNGWEPVFSTKPLELDAYAESRITVSLDAAIGLEFSAVGKDASYFSCVEWSAWTG